MERTKSCAYEMPNKDNDIPLYTDSDTSFSASDTEQNDT